jgi:23S rRNA (uracil1939-C5)-methyltransferase
MIEDVLADEIIGTIRKLAKSFKIKTYDEDTGYGLLRHVLVKRGFATGEVMVVLVTGSPVFPSRNNFVKALLKEHPQITTIVHNINDKQTSMVLGEREKVMYGKGYIEDILCGKKFRISAKSFYQVNPVQTEVLYRKAMEAAGFTGKEYVIDAYCGIGTIGMIASDYVDSVVGVELNRDAVRDAVGNARINGIKNVRFVCDDAGKFMVKLASAAERDKDIRLPDVVLMDPPRSGSSEAFLSALARMAPKTVVYVSCNPVTLERDVQWLEKKGYKAKGVWPVDMFPFTEHCEVVCLLSKGY